MNAANPAFQSTGPFAEIKPAVIVQADVSSSPGVASIDTPCSKCEMRGVCLPCSFSGQDKALVDDLVFTRRHVKRGAVLYYAGDRFASLYAVRSGFFKARGSLAEDLGREQITNFSMAGEVLGVDAIGEERHATDAIALEDSTVCVIPFSGLERAGRGNDRMQRQLHRLLGREISRETSVMMLLGSMNAEERLATFLLNLSLRFKARGRSNAQFDLCMTRDEIGSYLGLKLETVSRTLSLFDNQQLIEVRKKSIRIVDEPGLRRIFGRHR